MKKLFVVTILSMMLFLNGCEKNLSNIDVQTLNKKAAEYMEQGEYDKAISRLESILDLNDNFPETYFNLGVAYYQTNDYEKALQALNTAIEKKPDLADAFYSRAVVYESWAYSIIEGEDENNKKAITTEDKEKSLEYLQNAKADFEKYLEMKKDAKDKDDINEKIIQIDNELNNVSDGKKA